MSNTYIIQEGDTLSKISARIYGDPSLYTNILYANAFITNSDILPVGQTIILPVISNITSLLPNELLNEKQFILQVDNQNITNFTSIKITKSIDDVADRFLFSVPFNINDSNTKDLFKPFSFKPVKIFYKNVLQLTGVIVNINPSLDTSSVNLTIEGYSKPGILNDCNYPSTSYPLQFKGLKLSDIIKRTAQFFNLDVIDLVNDKYIFKDIDVDPTANVYNFLSELAKKRGVLLNSDAEGRIVIRKTSEIKANFSYFEGQSNVLSISTNYPGQEAFTTVTGLLTHKDEDDDDESEELLGVFEDDDDEKKTATAYTQIDPFMQDAGVARPFVYKMDNIESGSVIDAVKAKLRRGWADRINYKLEVKDIEMPSGLIWQENIRINLFFPSLMIYKEFEFLVRNVTITQDDKEAKTELELILPQSYNDEELRTLPWLN